MVPVLDKTDELHGLIIFPCGRELTVFNGQEEIPHTLVIDIIASSQSFWGWGSHNGGYEEFYLLAHTHSAV
jgi:hypothetical protein